MNPDFAQIVNEGQPTVPAGEEFQLQSLAEAPADRLALALDKARNNTSLVIVFRFQGKTLLFPGDAQWGNWQSWIGTQAARELLSEVDFIKIAHHGSENATPVDVVNSLRASGLAAMVSTQNSPFPTIPRTPLLVELEKHCLGNIAVRSDSVQTGDGGPAIAQGLPKGFKIGNSVGRPGMRDLQKKVLRDALSLLTQNTRPGEFVTIEYPEYGEQYDPPRVKKL